MKILINYFYGDKVSILIKELLNKPYKNISIIDISKFLKSENNYSMENKVSNDPNIYRIHSAKIYENGSYQGSNISDKIVKLIESYRKDSLKYRYSSKPFNRIKTRKFK